MTELKQTENSADAKPPVGGSWAALYAIVLTALAAEIALFAFFTEFFR